MRAQRPNGLGMTIEQFFREYLPTLRGVSPHTSCSISIWKGLTRNRAAAKQTRSLKLWA